MSTPERPRGRGRHRHAAAGRIWERPEAGRTAPRTPLARERITAAALAIADAEGLEALSMRRVARELGVGTMSLYHYLQGKDDLLDLMHDAVSAEMLVPGTMPADWREAVRAISHQTRDALLRHPWVVDVIGQRPGASPNGMRHVEQSAAAVDGLDVPPEVAGAILLAADDYTIGYVVRVLAARRGANAPETMRRQVLEPHVRELLASGEFPHLARFVAEGGLEVMAADRFDQGLDWLLDGIARSIAGA